MRTVRVLSVLAVLGACAASTGTDSGTDAGGVDDPRAATVSESPSDSWAPGSTGPAVVTGQAGVTGQAVVTEPTSAPANESIQILATGDVLVEGPVIAAAAIGDSFDFGRLLEPVSEVIAGADLAICHLELPIVDEGGDHGTMGRSPYGGNQLAAPHELADGLARAGFDRCSTASNHADDLAMEGVRSTLDALDAAGIGHSGTARSVEEAEMVRVNVAGFSVAHLSYTTYSNNRSLADDWALELTSSALEIAADARLARESGADVVVVSLHVSHELANEPTTGDRRLVEGFTALSDVDVVVMHGPHVVQPIEDVNGTLVFWSLGNFVSGMGGAGSGRYEDRRTLDGLVARITIEKSGSGAKVVDHEAVLVCTDPSSRRVYPALTTLLDVDTPDSIRSMVDECVGRSIEVVPGLR